MNFIRLVTILLDVAGTQRSDEVAKTKAWAEKIFGNKITAAVIVMSLSSQIVENCILNFANLMSPVSISE